MLQKRKGVHLTDELGLVDGLEDGAADGDVLGAAVVGV